MRNKFEAQAKRDFKHISKGEAVSIPFSEGDNEMFYDMRCIIQWFFAIFIALFEFAFWFYIVLIWILIKWIYGLFYKRKHGRKPYSKLLHDLPPFPNFGKLFKVPPRRESIYAFGQWWYNR